MHLLLTLLVVPILQVLLTVIVALPTWLLWNWIAVSVFELPALSVLQTFGLTAAKLRAEDQLLVSRLDTLEVALKGFRDTGTWGDHFPEEEI